MLCENWSDFSRLAHTGEKTIPLTLDRAGLQTGRAFVSDRFFRSGRGFGLRVILGMTSFASPLPGKKM